jgi:hypothetical protein
MTMARIIMFWDETDVWGDLSADIRIEGYGINNAIEIPENACGFRLRRPGNKWDEAWQFSVAGNEGEIVEYNGIKWMSSFVRHKIMNEEGEYNDPEYIEATGPVRHCAVTGPNTGPIPGPNPVYHFVLPLAEVVGEIDPFAPHPPAGRFVADFFDEDEIEWLDFAGEAIEFPELPEPEEPPENPFETIPEIGQVCFISGDGEEMCYDTEDSEAEAMVFDPGLATTAAGIAMLVNENTYQLSSMRIGGKQVSSAHRIPAGNKVEMTCPGEMRLSVSFFKAPAAPTTLVKYRFKFAGGPYSTTFSLKLDGDKTVVHSVPIPLRRPEHPGGGVSPASNEFGVYVKPVDPIVHGSTPVTNVGELVAEALPPNEHKGSVHVEVLNIPGGVIASGSVDYHVVCRPESGRPRLVVGMTGFTILPLQSALNPWLTAAGRPPLRLDGVFGKTTEAAVIEFQSEKGLEPTGVVGPSTWRRLLERRPYTAPPAKG